MHAEYDSERLTRMSLVRTVSGHDAFTQTKIQCQPSIFLIRLR